MIVYNSTVSAVPKEALFPKKEFLTSESTLKLVRIQFAGEVSSPNSFVCIHFFSLVLENIF